MTEIRVVAAIADKIKVVFYLENGNTLSLDQTDERLKKVLDVVIPLTSKGEVAIVNINNFSVYKEYQEKSKGIIKFFKATKKAVEEVFLGSSEEKPREELLSPQPEPKKEEVPVSNNNNNKDNLVRTSFTKHKSNLVPVDDDDSITTNETIVAVIGDTIIPNMEKLRPYITHALSNNSLISVQKFLERIAPTIEKRSHSIEDLFKFLENGDLPLANDGSIIAYKMLNLVSSEKDVFVDCHTGRIRQKVGSYVCVNEELVDRNRNNECSNGLHIARRGYLSGFSGTHCVLIKLAPEDVVTVPHKDPNKVRVMGYHILAVLSNDIKNTLKANKPMTSDSEASILLSNVIKGNHVARLEEVRVNGQSGTNIVITSLIGSNKLTKIKEVRTKAKAFDHDGTVTGTAEPINPKDINKRVDKEITKLSKNKTTKKPVTKTAPVKSVEKPKAVSKVKKPAIEPTASKTPKTPKVSPSTSTSKTSAKKTVSKTTKTSKKVIEPEKPMTNVEKIAELYDAWNRDRNQTNLDALMAHKKKAKLSFIKLGLTTTQINKLPK